MTTNQPKDPIFTKEFVTEGPLVWRCWRFMYVTLNQIRVPQRGKYAHCLGPEELGLMTHFFLNGDKCPLRGNKYKFKGVLPPPPKSEPFQVAIGLQICSNVAIFGPILIYRPSQKVYKTPICGEQFSPKLRDLTWSTTDTMIFHCGLYLSSYLHTQWHTIPQSYLK